MDFTLDCGNFGRRVLLGGALGWVCALCLSAAPVAAQFGGAPRASAIPNSPGGSVAGRQIVDVQIVGNRSVSDQEIRAEVETRAGQAFDPLRVQRDVRNLTKTRKFFDVKVKTRPGPSAGTVIVIFELFEHAKLNYIHFIGNEDISQRALNKQIEVKEGDPLDAVSLETAQRKIIDFYKERGYNKVQVEIREGLGRNDQGAVFAINEGPQQRVWNVKFVGNTIVSGSRLKTQIDSKPSKIKYLTPLAKGYVERRKIDEDVNRLTSYYRSLGYMVARVGRLLEFDDGGRWAELTFVIDEGPRFVVRSVTFSGNEIFGETQLRPLVGLTPGEHFDLAKMNKDVTQLTEAYGSVGFVMADISPSPRTLEATPEVDLVYEIAEGSRYRVGRINVTIGGDNPHTQTSVALDRISLQPGEIIDIRKLRDSERRLRASGLFLTDPVRGVRPQIVFREPDEDRAVAKGPGRAGTFRGQSPDRSGAGYPSVHSAGRPVADPPVRRPGW